MNWLYNFPNAVILLFFFFTSFIAMKVVHTIIHHHIKEHVPAEGHKLATNVHELVVMLISLVLAFSLGLALENTRTLAKAVSDEASQINNLDRLLLQFGDSAAEEVRPYLHAYTKSIVEDEWPDLLKGGLSEVTGKKFQSFSRAVIKLTPHGERETALYSSAIQLTDQIAQSRELRRETTEVKLPAVYWYVILVGILAELMISALLERGKYCSSLMSLQMIALSGMLALVFIFDQPYHGESGVQPDPLVRLIKLMGERHP
ncbi:MAG: hypothetical protein K0R08_1221 [Solimicrobium sp.]|jgi:hypothetical protein|nr:hypothetical protein [Solimicrobium sp.]